MSILKSGTPRNFALLLILFLALASVLYEAVHHPFHFGNYTPFSASRSHEASKSGGVLPLGPYPRKFILPEDDVAAAAEGLTLLDEAHLSLNGGFLRLREPSGRVGFYGVSMFHQIHCIEMLRDQITGIPSGHGDDHQRHEKPHGHEHGQDEKEMDLDHMIHCLDYLLQAIVCAADDTIEPARLKPQEGRLVAIIDGAHGTHQCRDFQTVAKIVRDSEEHPIDITELVDGTTVGMLGQ